MPDQMTMQCWEDLANAVVLRAAEDYAGVLRALRRRPGRKDLVKRQRSLERFFRSRWFRTLSAADGEELLMKIRKECRYEP